MTRSTVVPAAALAVASWLFCDATLDSVAAAAGPSKPHIVFFLADDLGYNNIGYHNHVTLSPHIDEFFGTGLQLNHSFSHKWCAPTRAALMSGRLPFKTGLEHGALGAYSAPEYALALSANFTLLPETLKKAGYTTHMLGKWNLGMWAKRYTPVGRGFDSYLGYLSADEQYYTHYKWPPFHGGAGTACRYKASLPSLYNITDLINGTDGELRASDGRYAGVYSTFMYGAEADRILDEAAVRQEASEASGRGRSPFFLYIAAQSIHTPLEAPAEYLALYPDAPSAVNSSDAQLIHAMVSALDDLVGNVTGKLKTSGLWDSTIMVFTSDNGGDTHGNNHPLRGGKFTTWDGGLRVVGAVNGGALDKRCQGRVADGYVHIADWHMTFAGLAGVTIDETGPRTLDSIDVWPHIASCGELPSPRKSVLHHYDGPNAGAYREGDLKLVIGGMSPFCYDTDYPLETSKRCKPGQPDPHPIDWRCTPCTDDPEHGRPCPSERPCLFNVSSAADPLETRDLSEAMPEIVSKMRATYDSLGKQACTAVLGSCLDYVGVADQAKFVSQAIAEMRLAPVPGAGAPLSGPPPPSPPSPTPSPSPPLPPSALLGNWTHLGDNSKVTVVQTSVGPPFSISFTTPCKPCCFKAGVGTVSDDGRTMSVNASSSRCVRIATGVVTGPAANLTIAWTAHKPDGGVASWKNWVKP